jgi:hypothetical protein
LFLLLLGNFYFYLWKKKKKLFRCARTPVFALYLHWILLCTGWRPFFLYTTSKNGLENLFIFVFFVVLDRVFFHFFFLFDFGVCGGGLSSSVARNGRESAPANRSHHPTPAIRKVKVKNDGGEGAILLPFPSLSSFHVSSYIVTCVPIVQLLRCFFLISIVISNVSDLEKKPTKTNSAVHQGW